MFFIWNWNSEFYPSLERIWNSIWSLYLRFFQFSIGSRLKLQNLPGILILSRTEFQQHPQLVEIITSEPLVIQRCVCTLWKGDKIIYHFCNIHFSWFCTKFSQQGFTRLLSVQIRICLALKKNRVNFLSLWFMWNLVCCLCSMDEILTRLSLVFDRWTTTPTPPTEPTDGFIAMGCTVLAFLPCSGTCCTTLATRGSLRTVATHTVSLGVDTVRSTWTSWLTPPTRAWRLCSPRLRVMNSMTLWRGLPTRTSWSFVSATYRGLVGTAVALFPIQNDGNAAWSERLAPVGDPKRPTSHAGWAFTVHYA
jgi:hypothetical protein